MTTGPFQPIASTRERDRTRRDAEAEVEQRVGLDRQRGFHVLAQVLGEWRHRAAVRDLGVAGAGDGPAEPQVVAGADRGARRRGPRCGDGPDCAEVLGEQHGLLLERAHLEVEHVLAAGERAAGVVDARDPGLVGEVADDAARCR